MPGPPGRLSGGPGGDSAGLQVACRMGHSCRRYRLEGQWRQRNRLLAGVIETVCYLRKSAGCGYRGPENQQQGLCVPDRGGRSGLLRQTSVRTPPDREAWRKFAQGEIADRPLMQRERLRERIGEKSLCAGTRRTRSKLRPAVRRSARLPSACRRGIPGRPRSPGRAGNPAAPWFRRLRRRPSCAGFSPG